LQSSAAKSLPTEHEAKPHHHVAGEPLSVDGDGPLAGGFDGAVGGGIEEDPAEREVGEGDRGWRREALLHERIDAERGAEEPGGGGVGLHDARHDADAVVAQTRRAAEGTEVSAPGGVDAAGNGKASAKSVLCPAAA
jgi:hypothetical protein